jgi:hypothetical protein
MLLFLGNIRLLHYNNRCGLNVAIAARAPAQQHAVANLDFSKGNCRRALEICLPGGKPNNARAIRHRNRNFRTSISFKHQVFFVD